MSSSKRVGDVIGKPASDAEVKPVLVASVDRTHDGHSMHELRRFETIATAARWVDKAGWWRSGVFIETPCGVATDVEAIALAKSLGLPHKGAKQALRALVGVNPDLP